MARTHGRALRGERLRSPIPHGHWKTTTFVAALRNSGMVAPMVLDGPINGAAFQAYIEPLRVCRRLQPLRGWSNEGIEELDTSRNPLVTLTAG
jgi:hypothetical protein